MTLFFGNLPSVHTAPLSLDWPCVDASRFIGFIYTERDCCFHLFGLPRGQLISWSVVLNSARGKTVAAAGALKNERLRLIARKRSAPRVNIGAKKSRNINKRLRSPDKTAL